VNKIDYFDFPYHVDGRGRTAETGEDDHIRDLIHQVLFTSPGERVNRPDFGCGVAQLVFQPNSDTLAAATQFLILGAELRPVGVQLWPGHSKVYSCPSSIDIYKVKIYLSAITACEVDVGRPQAPCELTTRAPRLRPQKVHSGVCRASSRDH